MDPEKRARLEPLAKLLCNTFMQDRGFSYGDNTDFSWEGIGAAAQTSWLKCAEVADAYVRAMETTV